jgi:hypothetical protein
MPNDMAIRPIAPAAPEPAAARAAPSVPSAPEPAGSAEALPNPTMRLDPALGLVVIEFHNSTGGITTSIPGQQQLNAYRTAREMDMSPNRPNGSDLPVHPSATRTV